MENDNYKISYNYDNRNNINKINYKLNNLINTLNYSYDNDSKQLSYTINNNLVTYDYDLFSRLNKKEIGNFITTYEYLNLEGNKTTTLLDNITNNNSKIRYVYDEVGNIKEIYKDNILENVYEYDSLNQLSLEKTYSLNQIIEYTYDNGGNILTKVYKNMSTDAIINTYSYIYDTNWKDQLINYNGNTITYDEIGNPLTYGNNITYTWINGRELSTYTDTSKNLEVTYSYNDEGIRISKIINGVEHKYYLEGTNIIYETIGEDILYYFYDTTGSIEGFKYNNDLYYYIKNGQNDIIGIIDDAGNKIVSYTYDSWGQVISITDNQDNEITDPTNIGNINPFRYRSYYYDSETELYYLNSRYYNPEMGRFINADGLVSTGTGVLSHNIYVYCNNNPINMLDDLGTWPSWNSIIKKAKKIGNEITEVGKGISNTIVNTGKKLINTVTDIYSIAKKSFVIDGGCGQGLGLSVGAGPANLELTAYQDVTYGIKNEKTYSNITGNAGIQFLGLGPSWSYEHQYPFPNDFTYWKNDRFNVRNILQSKYLINNGFSFDVPFVSFEQNNTFIGLSGSLHVGYGCHGKIGWVIK